MDAGLNIGYHAAKVVGAGRRAFFLSAVGSPDRPHFALSNTDGIVLLEPQHVLVGEEAVQQSRFLNRREDRAWIESDEWYLLALAALSELTQATNAEFTVVTGLPVAFYGDRAIVRQRLEGQHRVRREGRVGQTLTVTQAYPVPEPFGTLFDVLWDERGQVRDGRVATGEAGVLDIGSKTTNMLSVSRIREIGRESDSIEVGAWDVVRALREWLALPENCPHLKLRDHELAKAIISRQVTYYGKTIDLTSVVDEITTRLAAQIVAQAGQLWRDSLARFVLVIITGGGALMLGDKIRSYPGLQNAVIANDPVFANANGFLKYARYLRTR